MNRYMLMMSAILMLTTSSNGSVMFFTDQPTFNAAVAGFSYVGIETFEEANASIAQIASPLVFGVPNVDSQNRGFPSGLDFSPVSVSVSSGPGAGKLILLGPGFGPFTSHAVGSFAGGDTTQLDFSGGQYVASSMNIIIGQGGSGMVDITVRGTGGSPLGAFSLFAPESTPGAFLGIVSDLAITGVDVNGQSERAEILDNIALYTPEPATGLIVLFSMVIATRRRMGFHSCRLA